MLTGNKVTENTFHDFDEEISEETVFKIQKVFYEM